MRKVRMIVLTGVFIAFCAVGCQKTGEHKGDITKPTAEVVTDAPEEEEGPTEGALVTGSVQEEDVKLTFSFREESEEEKDGDYIYFKSTLYYPVFEGENAEAMNRRVSLMTEGFRESLPEAKENAKLDYEDFVSGEHVVPIFPEEEELIVSCLWEKEQYMTLFTRCVSSTGGAHPNVFCQAYVVNLSNGSQENFEQMLKPYGLTTEELVRYATEKIRAEHGEDLYVYDEEHDLEKDVYRFTQNNQWYFNDKGLVLFANPYEIAAYAYGMIECEISYEELEQGLKK